MRRLKSSPLTWMLIGEVALLAACAVLAWHVYEERTGAGPPTAVLPAPLLSPSPRATPRPAPAARATPSPVAHATPAPAPSSRGPDLAALLRQLNGDESAREQLEAGLVKALTEAMRAYLEQVVVPAVEKALSG